MDLVLTEIARVVLSNGGGYARHGIQPLGNARFWRLNREPAASVPHSSRTCQLR
jgi:hypothetical protein